MNPWLPTTFDPLSTAYRVFCLPHAGGGAALYHRWDRTLTAHIQLVPLRLPGREARIKEPAFADLNTLLRQMLPSIAPFCDRPFSIFGYSMGALIGFEFSRWLRSQQQRAPDHLFLAACRAPHLPPRREPLHDLEDSVMIERLLADYGMNEETCLEERSLMRMMSATIRADLQLVETYEYQQQTPLDIPITVLGGADDPQVSRPDLEGWRAQTASGFKVKVLPGHHFFLRTQQHAILDTLETTLHG